MPKDKRLSEIIADDILAMVTIDKKFMPGDKLPNENDLAAELNISRITLREAIRILATNGILEIKRGRGTFVSENIDFDAVNTFLPLSNIKAAAKDLYEMRLIFEPEAAYYAALRATDSELDKILDYGRLIESKILKNEDRTEVEKKFHISISKATHNEFMNKLMPVLYQAIDRGVALSANKELAVKDTLTDHRMIMDFMKDRDAEGARNAMKIHILHAMKELDIK
ncbi:MAG: FadR/GntR family transcriptional regulator [Bacillota bacterium]|nr:FadR/GntR family transcriptional regulator [Bacillota bacterium]